MKIIDTGKNSAEANMKIDHELLKELKEDAEPILHFYSWENPSATYGYFVDPYKTVKKSAYLDLARRPTGGGVIFHMTDLAFSVLIPAHFPTFSLNTMDNYRYIHTVVAEALKNYRPDLAFTLLEETHEPKDKDCCGFCMAQPTRYDVMVNGKKVAGGAQRRTKQGYLHQGSISLKVPDADPIQSLLMFPDTVWINMKKMTYPLIPSQAHLGEAKEKIKAYLSGTFQKEI